MGASDSGQVALVPVSKRLERKSCASPQDISGGMPSLLNGYGRNTRQGFSRLMDESRQVTDHKDFRMAGNGQIWLYQHSADTVQWYTQGPGKGRSHYSCSPKNCSRRISLLSETY